MTDSFVHPMIQKVSDSIKDLPPRDDKSHINSYLYDLDMSDEEEGVSVIKGHAAESLGMMARKYESGFIILCGAIPRLKANLSSKHQHVILSVARACTKIAYSSGATELLNNGFQEELLKIIKNEKIPFYIRNECTRAYGWIHVMSILEKEKEVYRLLR